MQYRLQASYRRRVTRRYLRLPLSWHHQHPTGQLLSNANADVEASWYPIAPFPMAVGVLVMLAVAVVSMVLTDPALAAVGLFVFPAILLVNLVYQRHLSPLATRAQAIEFRTRAISALHALVTSAPDSLRGRLRTLSLGELLRTCAAMRGSGHQSAEELATAIALRATARRALACEDEAASSDRLAHAARRRSQLGPNTSASDARTRSASLPSPWSRHEGGEIDG